MMRQRNKPTYTPLGIWNPSLRGDYSSYLVAYGKPKVAAPAAKPAKQARGKR